MRKLIIISKHGKPLYKRGTYLLTGMQDVRGEVASLCAACVVACQTSLEYPPGCIQGNGAGRILDVVSGNRHCTIVNIQHGVHILASIPTCTRHTAEDGGGVVLVHCT